MQRGHRLEGLIHVVRRCARRQIAAKTKGELGFSHAHDVVAERHRRTGRQQPVLQDAADQRPIDIDVLLSGLAGRGDLPSGHRWPLSRATAAAAS